MRKEYPFSSAPATEAWMPKPEHKIELPLKYEKFLAQNLRVNALSCPDVLFPFIYQLIIASKIKIKNPQEIMHGSSLTRDGGRKLARELHRKDRETGVVHISGFQPKGFSYSIVRRWLERMNNVPQNITERVKDAAAFVQEIREQGIEEANTMVLHLGDIMNSEFAQNPGEFFIFLQDKIAKPYKVKIALENIMQSTAEQNCQKQNFDINKFQWTYDLRETIKLLQRYNIDLNLVGVCLDTAHFGVSFEGTDYSLPQLLRDIQELINKDNQDPQNPIRLNSVIHNIHLVNYKDKKDGKKDDALPLADEGGKISLMEFAQFLKILQEDKYRNGLNLEVAPEPMREQSGIIGNINLLVGTLRRYVNQSFGVKEDDRDIKASVEYLDRCADDARLAMAVADKVA
jgi:hypothetical protein